MQSEEIIELARNHFGGYVSTINQTHLLAFATEIRNRTIIDAAEALRANEQYWAINTVLALKDGK